MQINWLCCPSIYRISDILESGTGHADNRMTAAAPNGKIETRKGDTGEMLANMNPATTCEGKDTIKGKILNIARIFPRTSMGMASACIVARDGV